MTRISFMINVSTNHITTEYLITEEELKQMKIQLSSAQTKFEGLEASVSRGNGILYFMR